MDLASAIGLPPHAEIEIASARTVVFIPNSCYGKRMNADEIFARHFWALYPRDVREDLSAARTTDANPRGNPSILARRI